MDGLAEVEEDEEIAGGLGDGGVESGGLAAGGGEEDGDEAGVGCGVAREEVVGGVGGAVGDEENLEERCGVVEGGEVGELAREVCGLVAGCHDDGDGGLEGSGEGGAWAHSMKEEEEHGIAGVGVEDQGRGDPEEEFH